MSGRNAEKIYYWVPEFAKSFEKIIDVSKKVTESFFKVLET